MRFWLLLTLAFAASAAHAQGVLADKSEIRFIGRQLGVNVEGRFRTFKANIVFLPGDLAKSKADIDVDLASIDLASDDSEKEIKDKQWFDTSRFPVARFTSKSFRSVGPGQYEVAGTLSLKGASQPVTLPFTVNKDAAGNTTAEGSFTLKRLDFKIGEGAWADTETVANDVVVRVRLVLPPVK
jgi:polyisoprenoid-binding protein YceI